MFKNNGIVTIKKKSILYFFHEEEDNIFIYDNKILHCNFHPFESNRIYLYKYISCIEIKKDIQLLFMIKTFCNKSLLTTIERPFISYHSQNIEYYPYNKMIELCKKNNKDGWFSSIRNGSRGFVNSEISLINNPEIFSIISVSKYINDVKKIKIQDELIVVKNINEDIIINRTKRDYGNIYPICSTKYPLYFHIHNKFKELINDFLNYDIIPHFTQPTVFQIVLSNANIKYYHEE
jgi:hypothetical protein